MDGLVAESHSELFARATIAAESNATKDTENKSVFLFIFLKTKKLRHRKPNERLFW